MYIHLDIHPHCVLFLLLLLLRGLLSWCLSLGRRCGCGPPRALGPKGTRPRPAALVAVSRRVPALFFFFVVFCRGVCLWAVGAGAVPPGPLARRGPAPAPPPFLRSLVWVPALFFFVVVFCRGLCVWAGGRPRGASALGRMRPGRGPPPLVGSLAGSVGFSFSSWSFIVVPASGPVAAPVALRPLAGCAPGAVPRPLLGPWPGSAVFRFRRRGRLSWSPRLGRWPPPWRCGSWPDAPRARSPAPCWVLGRVRRFFVLVVVPCLWCVWCVVPRAPCWSSLERPRPVGREGPQLPRPTHPRAAAAVVCLGPCAVAPLRGSSGPPPRPPPCAGRPAPR